jgi:hypothetical protein
MDKTDEKANRGERLKKGLKYCRWKDVERCESNSWPQGPVALLRGSPGGIIGNYLTHYSSL